MARLNPPLPASYPLATSVTRQPQALATRLLLLNGVAIFGVVLFHAAGVGFTAMFSDNWVARYDPTRAADAIPAGYYALRGVEQLVAGSVAAFVFVSGFFVAVIAGRNGKHVEWSTVLQRVKYLAFPYLLWSVLIAASDALQGRVFSPWEYIYQFLTGSMDPAYYFVPLLAQLYLLAPIISPVAKTDWKRLLMALVGLQLLLYAAQYSLLLGFDHPAAHLVVGLTPKWLFSARIFWFSFGMVLGAHWTTVRDRIERLRWVWLSGGAALLVLGIVEWEAIVGRSGLGTVQNQETLVDGLYSVCVIFCFLAFSRLDFPLAGTFRGLGTKSYGVFLIHSPVMQAVSRGLYHFAPWLLASQFLLQPILISVGLGVPLCLMYAVRRSRARSCYTYLFG